MNKKFLSVLMATTLSLPMFGDSEVINMRTLGLQSPIGIESTPSFSWMVKSSERGFRQRAYEINVTDAMRIIDYLLGKR